MLAKLRILIVDDEQLARQRLRRLLQSEEDVEIVGESGSGRDAIGMIKSVKPDLVFLDVQMPEVDGFQVLQELPFLPQVVFATAFDQYAIRAFEVNALDYLVKPITRERLKRALDRSRQRLASPSLRDHNYEALRSLLEESRKKYVTRIPAQKRNEILLVEAESIHLFEVDSGILRAHLENGSVSTHYSLNELEQMLDPGVFFKANRSTLINLGKIEKLTPWFGSRVLAKLKNGKEVEVSRIQTRKLKELLHL